MPEKGSYNTKLLTLGLAFIALATVIGYSNTLHAPFVLDDSIYIIGNHRIRELSNLWPPVENRYLTLLSFALNYRLGGLNVTGYHAANIAIHILNAGLVSALVLLILRTSWIREAQASLPDSYALGAALLASLVFAVHPLQTQAVTYITQRFASLATFFYLLSLVLYLCWRASNTRARPFLYILSLASAIASYRTKEISFTLPFVMALIEFMFMGPGLKRRLPGLAPFFLAAIAIPLGTFGPRLGLWAQGTGIGEEIRGLQAREFGELSAYGYLMTQFRVIITYIRLLIFPVNQNLYYDYPSYGSFLNPAVAISFLCLSVILACAVYIFLWSERTLNIPARLAAFGVFWFFATLSVESSIIPIRDVIFEHRVYLPSIGFAITLSFAIFYVIGRINRKNAAFTAGAATIAALLAASLLAVATYKRNGVWKDELILWQDVVKKSYNNSFAHNGIGVAYQRKGRFLEAEGELRQALTLKPDLRNIIHNNIGALYESTGLLDEAAAEYLAALTLQPGNADILYNIANVYMAKGLVDEAVEGYTTALKIRPYDVDIIYNLGRAYRAKGLLDEAIRMFDALLRMLPNDPDAHLSLGQAYEEKGEKARAVIHYRRFLDLAPPEYRYRDEIRTAASRVEALRESR
ncbi:MAG: tetratricopeptide repeat protein [Deltaproteobacteria bacterium]|nr:tetratricopeptide repeat protein [Deltaproteobacteria bacterium]